jgi:hypothetical protein
MKIFDPLTAIISVTDVTDVLFAKSLWNQSGISRNPPRLIAREQLGR